MNEDNNDHNGAAYRVVDAYLLGERVTKSEAIAALLSDRSRDPALAPFYRAFEAIGVRAADEAIVALRLLLSGHEASDARVHRVRTLARIVRAAARGERAGVDAALEGDPAVLTELSGGDGSWEELSALGKRARDQYFRELGT